MENATLEKPQVKPGSVNLPDPAITVQENASNPAETTVWHISQNLTDRWGDLNFYDAANKPHAPLIENPALLEQLTDQMCDEITFVTRKDGQYGLLFEVEYCSIESETSELHPADPNLKPHDKVVQALLNGIDKLRQQFPGVPMCVPDKAEIVEERPAVWAFVQNGQLDTAQRNALGTALMSL